MQFCKGPHTVQSHLDYKLEIWNMGSLKWLRAKNPRDAKMWGAAVISNEGFLLTYSFPKGREMFLLVSFCAVIIVVVVVVVVDDEKTVGL